MPIPDSAGANTPGVTAVASLPIVSPGNLASLTFSLDGTACSATAGSTTVGLNHTFVNDLQIDLKSPGGTLVTVINRTDGGGNNFCQTLLDDAAGTNIQSALTAQAPFTGTWQPANPLSGFAGDAITGTWELHVADFFIADTGSIRAWSLNLTPAVCDAPALASTVTATKTVSGSFTAGGAVTYTVQLSNSGSAPALNATFTDTLPGQVAVGTPTATSGAVSGTGVNPVTWSGNIPVGVNSVTITIPATINGNAGGQTVVNQGAVSYDADLNGSNESTAQTDDPGLGGSTDPTSFTVTNVSVLEIPTLSEVGLALLALMLSAAAVLALRRRSRMNGA